MECSRKAIDTKHRVQFCLAVECDVIGAVVETDTSRTRHNAAIYPKNKI